MMTDKHLRIGFELRSLNNLIMRRVDHFPNKSKVDSITGTNGWIIGFLAGNDDREIYQRDIEKHFSITRSTASRVISLMEKKGLIKRVAVSHDARLKKISLTDKALEISDLMIEDARYMERILVAGFTEVELVVLDDFLQRMKANISAESR